MNGSHTEEAIFYVNDEQKMLAKKSKEAIVEWKSHLHANQTVRRLLSR